MDKTEDSGSSAVGSIPAEGTLKNMINEYSAGGVVFRRVTSAFEILIGQHSSHHGWVFPKGIIGDHVENEQKEDTAVREVQEETGITGKILHELTPYSFFYTWKGKKRKKAVTFFVMEYVTGETKDHDWEMEEVIWLPINEVTDKLTYPAEKKVWLEAKEFIEKNVE